MHGNMSEEKVELLLGEFFGKYKQNEACCNDHGM
jgi:hypothetical protein